MQNHLPIMSLGQAFAVIQEMRLGENRWEAEDGWNIEPAFERCSCPLEYAMARVDARPEASRGMRATRSRERTCLHRLA